MAAFNFLSCGAWGREAIARRPAARQLRRSLLAYAASDEFAPEAPISDKEIRAILN